jgi:hypothetical protein
MHSYLESFPYLEQLLGGWFHQDFDLAGGTIEAIMENYRSTAHPHDVMGVKADIQRFIHNAEANKADLEKAFVKQFNPDVLPAAWGMSTKNWLLYLNELL